MALGNTVQEPNRTQPDQTVPRWGTALSASNEDAGRSLIESINFPALIRGAFVSWVDLDPCGFIAWVGKDGAETRFRD